jgi:hypothetical protein
MEQESRQQAKLDVLSTGTVEQKAQLDTEEQAKQEEIRKGFESMIQTLEGEWAPSVASADSVLDPYIA